MFLGEKTIWTPTPLLSLLLSLVLATETTKGREWERKGEKKGKGMGLSSHGGGDNNPSLSAPSLYPLSPLFS